MGSTTDGKFTGNVYIGDLPENAPMPKVSYTQTYTEEPEVKSHLIGALRDDDSPWDIAKALIDATTTVGDKKLPAFDFDDLETIARLLQAYVDITRRYIYGEDGA